MVRKRRVVWAHAAIEDLEAAFEYIRRDSRAYASSFMRRAREAVQSLREFAERGRIVPEFGDKNVREIFVQSYRVIYHIEEQRVVVVALIHGHRDLLSLWEKEGRTIQ